MYTLLLNIKEIVPLNFKNEYSNLKTNKSCLMGYKKFKHCFKKPFYLLMLMRPKKLPSNTECVKVLMHNTLKRQSAVVSVLLYLPC